MATVTVREQGAVVRRRGQRLAVTKERELLDEIQLIHLDQLVLMGNVQLTTAALVLLVREEIPVVFLSRHGSLQVVIDKTPKNIELRRKQMEMFGDESNLLPLARAAVIGKLTNQRTFLQRQGGGTGVATAVEGIGRMIEGARQAPTLDTLRGYEGNGAAHYFAAWRLLLPPALGFAGRAFHPAPDPVNALLGFGYTLLLKEMNAAVQGVGLDPYFGFFHSIENGRPSLPLDLIEEFRPILVDSMVFDLIGRGLITPQEFERTGNPDRPVLLTEVGRDRVLRAYEERLSGRMTHPLEGRETSYRRCLELQARQIAQIVQGEAAGYMPITIR